MKTLKLFTMLLIATLFLSCDKDTIADPPCECIKYVYNHVVSGSTRIKVFDYKEPVICQEERTIYNSIQYTITEIRCNENILK